MTDEKKQEPVRYKTPMSVRFSFFMMFVTAIVFLPSTILLFVCMIPTLVAWVIDNQARKTAWLTVGAMNLAGTVPVWVNLLEMGHTVAGAFHMITDPKTIMLSYGGAVVGWAIYYNVTPFVASVVLKKNERRLRDIEARQQDLIKKWGKEVIS